MPTRVILVEVVQFRRAVAALRLVFWGGLVTILEFQLSVKIGLQSRSVQLLPDFIGLAILLPGLFRLTWMKVTSLYEVLMSAVLGVCCAWALGSLFFTFRPDLVDRLDRISASFAPLAASITFIFALSMLLLSKSAGAQSSQAAWQRASLAVLTLVVLPNGVAWLASAPMLSRESGTRGFVAQIMVSSFALAGWLFVLWALKVMSREAVELPTTTSLASDTEGT
jgi:hypothetical protein